MSNYPPLYAWDGKWESTPITARTFTVERVGTQAYLSPTFGWPREFKDSLERSLRAAQKHVEDANMIRLGDFEPEFIVRVTGRAVDALTGLQHGDVVPDLRHVTLYGRWPE